MVFARSTTFLESGNSLELEEASAWLKSIFASESSTYCDKYVENELTLWKLDKKAERKGAFVDVILAMKDIKPFIQDVNSHIDEAASCAEQNIYFVDAIREGRRMFQTDYGKFNAKQREDFKKTAKRAICHSIFLHAFSQLVSSDWIRAENIFLKVLDMLSQMSKFNVGALRYFKYFSSFDNIKANTVITMMYKDFEMFKKGAIKPEDTKKCGVRFNNVGMNIAEAMYYDDKDGYSDNALAGAVMVATPHFETDEPKLEAQKPKYNDDPKMYLVFQPFPDQWGDLYSVWNLAFTARQFQDFPMYWAKLLNPTVGCHRRVKGSYIFNRAINLLFQIIHEVAYRNSQGEEDPGVDVRLTEFTKAFGTSNKFSGDHYFLKVQNHDPNEARKQERKFLYQDMREKILHSSKSLIRKAFDLIVGFAKKCFDD